MFKFESNIKQQNRQEYPRPLPSHTISPDAGRASQKILYCLEQMPSTPAYLPQDFRAEMQRGGIAQRVVKVYHDHGLVALGQRAYARGNEIHVASDIPLSSAEGSRILRHELSHVIQQGSDLLNSGTESDWERQADSLHSILSKRNTIPAGIAGYPAQGIDKFDIPLLPEAYDNLTILMGEFNKIDYSDNTATPKTRKAMFSSLHKIDLEVYSALNQGMDVEGRKLLKDIPNYDDLQHILEISNKNYTELIGTIIKNSGSNNEEIEIPVAQPNDQNQIRSIWSGILANNTIMVAPGASDEYKRKIYSYMGKMLHYETGIKLLSAALSGGRTIEVSPTDGNPAAVPGNESYLSKCSNQDQIPSENSYNTIDDFEKDFFTLLSRKEENAINFSIGNQNFQSSTGCATTIKMPETMANLSFHTGSDEKEAQSEPWLVFAHELGHAVKNVYGINFNSASLYPEANLKTFYPGSKNEEEYANNSLVENPLRRESGMRSRIQYTGLELLMANRFLNQVLYVNLKEFMRSLETLINDDVIGTNDMRKLHNTLSSPGKIAQKIMENGAHATDELQDALINLPYIDRETGKILEDQVQEIKNAVAGRIWEAIEARNQGCFWCFKRSFVLNRFNDDKKRCICAGGKMSDLCTRYDINPEILHEMSNSDSS